MGVHDCHVFGGFHAATLVREWYLQKAHKADVGSTETSAVGQLGGKVLTRATLHTLANG